VALVCRDGGDAATAADWMAGEQEQPSQPTPPCCSSRATRSYSDEWDALRACCCSCCVPQKVSVQQSSAYGGGVAALDDLLAQLTALQERLVGGEAGGASSADGGGVVALATRLNKSAADCKTKLNKDFKNLHTAATKFSAKLDKVNLHSSASGWTVQCWRRRLTSALVCETAAQSFSTSLDEFCKAELFESPAYLDAAAASAAEEPTAAVAPVPALPFATLMPVAPVPATASSQPAQQVSNGTASSAGTASAATAAAAQRYSHALAQVMEECWLRAGRMDLVESLRAEEQQISTAAGGGPSQRAESATIADVPMAPAASSDSPAVPAAVSDTSPSSPQSAFRSLHSLIRALKRRDADPCMAWVIAQKADVQQQLERTQAEMERQRELTARAALQAASSGTAGAPSDPSAPRRKRVSFNAPEGKDGESESGEDPAGAEASSAVAALAASLSSLSTRLSQLETSYNALHALHFDLHRVKFLQLLSHSEEEARQSTRARESKQSRKRKPSVHSPARSATVARLRPSISSSAPDSSSGGALEPSSSVQEEEAAAMAAEQTSGDDSEEEAPEEEDGTQEDDAQLNAVAAAAARRAGIRTPATAAVAAHSSFSHHAALKYAQTFFPQFAATQMDGIRRLSGCLLFLGELTSSPSSTLPPSHPYASLFSPAGNRQLWQDAIQRAKRLAFARMHRPEQDPLAVTLRACDVSLPQLLKYQSVLRQNADLLSVGVAAGANPEIELGADFQFHSTFVCPVTKEQCTDAPDDLVGAPTIDLTAGLHPQQHPAFFAGMPHGVYGIAPPLPIAVPPAAAPAGASSSAGAAASSAGSSSNPPVMLKCGHCISQHAMEKIVRTMRMPRRFKCPTCPQEQSHTEVLILHL